MKFVIRWNWNPANKGPFICGLSRSKKPYTENIKEVKTWKTRKNAERYLSRKDPIWASQCEILELT